MKYYVGENYGFCAHIGYQLDILIHILRAKYYDVDGFMYEPAMVGPLNKYLFNMLYWDETQQDCRTTSKINNFILKNILYPGNFNLWKFKAILCVILQRQESKYYCYKKHYRCLDTQTLATWGGENGGCWTDLTIGMPYLKHWHVGEETEYPELAF